MGYCFVVLLCTAGADAIKMKINIFTIVLPLFIFTDWVNSANLQNIIGQSRGSCPTGSVGEFATFGFLTFMITLLNTILNLVITRNIVSNNNNNNNNDKQQ